MKESLTAFDVYVFVSVCVCLPDKYRSVQQTDDRRDIDAHQDLAVDVLQSQVAVLHLSVCHVVVEDQLHLQQSCSSADSHTQKHTHEHVRAPQQSFPLPSDSPR